MRTAILISGRGSNMQAIVSHARAPDFPADIVLVLSDRPEAGGLEIAAKAGIVTETISYGSGRTKVETEAALDSALRAADVELICLAGFMRVLSREFVQRWPNQIVNIHPSLLPAFKGLDTHRRALDAGVKIHGASVHFVRAELDSGPILIQAAVPVLAGDDERSLANRVLSIEHEIYPEAVRLLAGGSVDVSGEQLLIQGSPNETAERLVWPPVTGMSD